MTEPKPDFIDPFDDGPPAPAWPNPFAHLASVGFLADLLPIIPPDAQLSAQSKVKRGGKTPGLMKPDGTWTGFPGWSKHATTAADLSTWAAWPGVGVGMNCRRVRGVDIDVTDPTLAEAIEAAALRILGPAPRRVGAPPKRLLVYRCETAGGKRSLVLTHRATGKEHLVEILAVGEQFIVRGTHPGTGRPYSWSRGDLETVGFDGLTEITPEMIEQFMTEVAELAGAEYDIGAVTSGNTASDRRPIGHPDLKQGEPEVIRAALAVIGNNFTYDEWLPYCCAIKAALGGDRYDVFAEWCALSPKNDENFSRTKWDVITDSTVDANLIYDMARLKGWQGWVAVSGFEPCAPDGPKTAAVVIPFTEILRRDPRPVQWLIPDLIEKGVPNFIDGDGGAGKGRISLQFLLCVDTGTAVFGRQVEKATAVHLCSEDDVEEITRRVHSIVNRLELPREITGQLWDCEGVDSAIARVHENGDITLLPPHKVLVERLKAIPGHKLVLVDSQYDFVKFAGNAKIAEDAANNFIKQVLVGLCNQTDSTLIVIRHASQAGIGRGDYGGWSVANSNAARNRLTMRKDAENQDCYVLKIQKRNHGKEGGEIRLFWSDGALLPHDAMQTTEQAAVVYDAVIKMAIETANVGEPITQQRKVLPSQISRVEELCGVRLSSHDIKDKLSIANRAGKLRYQKGHGKNQAGYFPPMADG